MPSDFKYPTEQNTSINISEKYKDKDTRMEKEMDCWARQGVSVPVPVESKALLSRALSNVRTVKAYSLQEEVRLHH